MKKILFAFLGLVSLTAFAQYHHDRGENMQFGGVIISNTPPDLPGYLHYERPRENYRPYDKRDDFEIVNLLRDRRGNYKVLSGIRTNRFEDVYLKPMGYCPIRSGIAYVNLSNNRKYGVLVDRDIDCEVSVHRIRVNRR